MRPILFEWGDHAIRSYAVSILLAALVSGYLAWRRRPEGLLSTSQYLDLCIVIALAGGLGARLVAQASAGALSVETCLRALAFWQAAPLAAMGVPLLALPAMAAYCLVTRVPLVPVFDHLLPLGVLGAGIHRLFGCFLNGCCAGVPSTLPWAVAFPPSTTPVHPTQLYLGVLLVGTYAGAARWSPAEAGRKSLFVVAAFALASLAVMTLRAE